MRHLATIILASILGLCAPASAQNLQPQTYSFTQDPGIPIMGPDVVTVSRDGAKEAIEQVMPISALQPKGFHSHLLYDFQAHTVYTQILTDPSTPCSVMTYSSLAAPAELDTISGSADIMKQLTSDASVAPQPIGTESIDGIPAKIFAVSNAKTKGRIWIADKGGYPLKVAMTGPDGKQQTLIEIKHLSFARPPASNFIAPAGCQLIQGEATATGVHAEIGEPPQGSKPAHNVTAATLQPIPHYRGRCPAPIKMSGTITTDGPGTVWYWFGAGQTDPGEALAFTSAGTKTVTHVMTFTVDPKFGNSMGGSALLQAVMEDKQGIHASTGTASNNSDFSIDCTSR